MALVQAIVLSCSEKELTSQLPDFFENQLNYYSIDPRVLDGGIKAIFEGGEVREKLFKDFEYAILQHGAPKIILINHLNCNFYNKFSSTEDEIHEHEIQLRHAVSDFHARFPNKEVEAYLAVTEDNKVNFKQII
jgi:hypothetical protein